MTTTLRARFDGKALVPIEPVDLQPGAVFEVQVMPASDPPNGSPALLLQILNELPHVSKEAMEEFDRALEEGK